jgi:hypothetical protein
MYSSSLNVSTENQKHISLAGFSKRTSQGRKWDLIQEDNKADYISVLAETEKMIEDSTELIDAALKSEVSLASSRRLGSSNYNSRYADSHLDDAYKAFELQNEDKKITRKRSDYPTTALTRFTGDRLVSMYDESSHDLGFSLKSTEYSTPRSATQHENLLSSLNNQIMNSLSSIIPDYLIHNVKSTATDGAVAQQRTSMVNKYVDELNHLKVKNSIKMSSEHYSDKLLTLSSINNKFSDKIQNTKNSNGNDLYGSLVNNISEILFVNQLQLDKKYVTNRKSI